MSEHLVNLTMRVKRALVRRPHTDAELDEIVAQIDAIIRDLESHQIQLSRQWRRKHPRKEEGYYG